MAENRRGSKEQNRMRSNSPSCRVKVSAVLTLNMDYKRLAKNIGSISVSGEVLTGEALVKYLKLMPPEEKESMLDDIALLKALAIQERLEQEQINERVTE